VTEYPNPQKKMRIHKPKAPKDSKIHKAVMVVIALRAQGKGYPEVAELTGLTVNTLRTYMHRAHKAGWLNFDSLPTQEDQIDVVLKSKTVRNIDSLLDSPDPEIRKDVTMETAKGLGLFKSHQIVKGDSGPPVMMALSVKVEMPPVAVKGTAPMPQIELRAGTFGGSPSRGIPIDAELVEEGDDDL
jgi:DNA-directed RNA polymerase specialized sigma subunit, sigma24 homolog